MTVQVQLTKSTDCKKASFFLQKCILKLGLKLKLIFCSFCSLGNRIREVFHTTPRMPAYLISFHVSEEFAVLADNNDRERPYRILGRPTAAGQGEYALEVGPPVTKWLEDYLDIGYYTMGEDMKNDQIAVPDWASGATENWGFVSYRLVFKVLSSFQTVLY